MEGSRTSRKDSHLLKAERPKEVTESGRETDSSAVQSENAELEMARTPSSILTERSFLYPLKASFDTLSVSAVMSRSTTGLSWI